MRIGIDLDGSGWHDFFERWNWIREFQGEPKAEVYSCWHWYREMGMTDAEFVAWCHKAADDGLLFGGEPFEGAVEVMERIHELGHTIVIITDRTFGSTPEVSQALTIANLKEYGAIYDEIYFDADKTKYNVDMMIEDKISNYDALIAVGVDAYLVNGPQNYVEGGDMRNRINSIHEFQHAVEMVTDRGYADLALV